MFPGNQWEKYGRHWPPSGVANQATSRQHTVQLQYSRHSQVTNFSHRFLVLPTCGVCYSSPYRSTVVSFSGMWWQPCPSLKKEHKRWTNRMVFLSKCSETGDTTNFAKSHCCRLNCSDKMTCIVCVGLQCRFSTSVLIMKNGVNYFRRPIFLVCVGRYSTDWLFVWGFR